MKKTSNRALGDTFEQELCDLLFGYGFWAHDMKQNNAGQPADVIAVRNGKAYLIDAKVCSVKGFDLRRVEENQDLAMTLWKERGNGEGWFALKVEEKVFMIPHFTIIAYRNSQSFLSFSEIFECGKLLEQWSKEVSKYENGHRSRFK